MLRARFQKKGGGSFPWLDAGMATCRLMLVHVHSAADRCAEAGRHVRFQRQYDQELQGALICCVLSNQLIGVTCSKLSAARILSSWLATKSICCLRKPVRAAATHFSADCFDFRFATGTRLAEARSQASWIGALSAFKWAFIARVCYVCFAQYVAGVGLISATTGEGVPQLMAKAKVH